jgi:hypothetical protein
MGIAVTRTIRVFELLAQEPDGLTLSELAERMDASKSSLAPILTDLLEQKYLYRGERKKYQVGPKFTLISRSRLHPVSNEDIGKIRLFGLLIEEARLAFSAHGVVTFSWDEESKMLCPTYSYSKIVHDSVKLRSGEGLAGQVWKTNQAILVKDYARWKFALPGFRSSEWHHHHMAAPIRQGQVRIGVVVVRSHDDSLTFDESDLGKLVALTQEISGS